MSDPPPDSPLDEALLETSLFVARRAAAFQYEMEGQIGPEDWSEKATSDFVTEVDRESERRIVALIRRRFPGHAVLAEEGATADPGPTPAGSAVAEGNDIGDAPILWIIDPLDGTTNWLHGYPAYAVSIATLDAHGLRTAVVINSATGEEFAAIRGRGATRDGEAIHVSTVAEVRLALLGTGFPFKKRELLPRYLRALGAMLENTSGVRRTGAAALDLCDLACGRLDAFWEHWLMEWDVAAGALIVREAGGTFGPLPGTSDPVLADATAGGRHICAAFAGEGDLMPPRGGGFWAGNGRLEPELSRIWIGTEEAEDVRSV